MKFSERKNGSTQHHFFGSQKSGAGFTLIELLVVVSIIGLLVSVVLSSLSQARLKSRNTKRQADLAQIQVSLEQYYDDIAEYPRCDNQSLCCSTGPCGASGTWGNLQIVSTYMKSMPVDPTNVSGQYGYYYARGYRKTGSNTYISTGSITDYILATRLEGQAATFSGWNNSMGVGNGLNYLLGN